MILPFILFFAHFSRCNKTSFERGVVNQESFEYGNKRRLVSLKICFVSWLYEFLGVAFTYLTPVLLAFGAFNIYFIDAILMFVVLPAMYLINDEGTKTVITQHGWIQGVRQMLGMRTQILPQAPIPGS